MCTKYNRLIFFNHKILSKVLSTQADNPNIYFTLQPNTERQSRKIIHVSLVKR